MHLSQLTLFSYTMIFTMTHRYLELNKPSELASQLSMESVAYLNNTGDKFFTLQLHVSTFLAST